MLANKKVWPSSLQDVSFDYIVISSLILLILFIPNLYPNAVSQGISTKMFLSKLEYYIMS